MSLVYASTVLFFCVLTGHPKKDVFVVVKYFSSIYFVNNVGCELPNSFSSAACDTQQLHTLRFEISSRFCVDGKSP